MSGSACGPWCSWCGGCSSAWESPARVRVSCVACHRELAVDADERPPYRCRRCVRQADRRQQQAMRKDVA